MARDTILFDINETVLDLSSLKPKFEAIFNNSEVMPTWFATLLHTSTVCVMTGVQTGFASLAGTALDTVAARRAIVLSNEQRTDILSGIANLQPHSDIVPALTKLRANGYRTVAFSNSSLELVTKQISNANLLDVFDDVISVEETGSFKPDVKVYHFAAERLGCPIGELRLIATHDWDTHGAMVAGMQAAYIDRSNAAYHPLFKQPKIYATSMSELVQKIIDEDKLG